MEQLDFFIGPKIERLRRRERWIFRFEADSGRLWPRPNRALERAVGALPSTSLQTALRLRPRRALSSAEAKALLQKEYSI
jgi:hypothetical protein